MKKIRDIGLTGLFIIILIGFIVIYYLKIDNYASSTKELTNVSILPTIITKLEDNTVYCPTFQLVWNDLKNEVVKKDVVLIDDEDNQTVKDLNKETFSTKDINDNIYYKRYGFTIPSLKNEIKKALKDKFNQESDILDSIDFYENSKDYLFYAMLYKKFKFINPFDILNDETFGINSKSDSKLDSNIDVLYYNSTSDYAVLLKTKTGDEIVLYKGSRKDNFLDIYNNIDLSKRESFKEDDTISISNLDFKVKQEFKELENKKIVIEDSDYNIDKALEIVEFKLDNKGGKVKSEAGLLVKEAAIVEGRHFDFKDDFILFVKEKDKDLPYLAININDINEFK